MIHETLTVAETIASYNQQGWSWVIKMSFLLNNWTHFNGTYHEYLTNSSAISWLPMSVAISDGVFPLLFFALASTRLSSSTLAISVLVWYLHARCRGVQPSLVFVLTSAFLSSSSLVISGLVWYLHAKSRGVQPLLFFALTSTPLLRARWTPWLVSLHIIRVSHQNNRRH